MAVQMVGEQLRRHLENSHVGGICWGTQPEEDEALEPGLSRHGWQKTAHKCFEIQSFQEREWPAPDSTDSATSRSQRGPLAATPFVSLPSKWFSKFDPQSFRLLLRRRLRLPIPLSSRSCRCGRQLDPLGHHRAGCSEKVFRGDEDSLWKGQQYKCAVKLEEGLLRTSGSETWAWQCSTTSLVAGWKWWRMVTLWDGQQTTTGSHWSTHGAEKRPRTQNSLVKWVAPDWPFRPQRWVDGSPLKRRLS